MTNAGIDQNLQDLYQASDLAQLRARLGGHLAQLGFWGVCEFRSPMLVNQDYFDLRNYIWDNFARRVGGRRDELRRAFLDAAAARGIREENRRLRWMAARRRPFLAISGTPARFKAHDELCRLVEDFGLSAVDALVFPIAGRDPGPHRIWALAESQGALKNTEAAIARLTVYHYVSQCLQAEGKAGTDGRASGPANPGALTPRQREVLRWAATGKTGREIALITGMSSRTVRYHIQAAQKRYGLENTQQTIVRAALDYGFDPHGPC